MVPLAQNDRSVKVSWAEVSPIASVRTARKRFGPVSTGVSLLPNRMILSESLRLFCRIAQIRRLADTCALQT